MVAFEVEHPLDETALQPGRHYLLYQLEQDQDQHRLSIYKAYLKKNGDWSQCKPYLAPYYAAWNVPDFYLPQDSSVMQQLQQPGLQSCHDLLLTGTAGAQVLNQLQLSRRLILADGQFLHTAPQRTLHWQWQTSDTEQRLLAELEGVTNWEPIAVTPPYYLDRDNAVIGEIAPPLTGSQLAHLYNMPPAPNEHMPMVSAQLRRVFKPEQLPLAKEPPLVTEAPPVPHLTLTMTQSEHGAPIPAAQLHFDYGPIALAPLYHGAFNTESLLQQHDGQAYLIERQDSAEKEYALQLQDLGLWPSAALNDIGLKDTWMQNTGDAAQALRHWQELLEQDFPELERRGWRISEAADYRFDIELQDSHHSWFDFSLGLQQGETKLDTMEVIGAWLQADMPAELLLPVGDDWLRVDTQPLWTIRDLLIELFDQKLLDRPITLPAFQAAQLQNLELDDRQAPLTRDMMAQLQDFTGLQPVAIPAGLNAELRPYQQQGLNWLAFLHRYGLGGILADDMGLGKTLQTLTLIQHLKETDQLQQPAMILAPSSTWCAGTG